MIYDFTLRALENLPKSRPVSLLLRHSIRYPILNDDEVFKVGLTPEGVEAAENFGKDLASIRPLGRLVSNYVGRCVDTAAAIGRGARIDTKVGVYEHLSYAYVQRPWESFLAGERFRSFPREVGELIDLVLDYKAQDRATVDILVTHDSVIGCVLAYLMDYVIEEATWPQYLEGMFFWQENGNTYTLWRDQVMDISSMLENVEI